ncbi:transglutaminase-like domain-containing protein [Paenibacillus sp. HB172176]|uniref:transglutaminase-like domain-containing protein n=1 Tax=Paenibacillus sp. HB172176 TaxID=2493690 RepID=UPI00143B8B73|nr:transglutaminase-like domain-containing protein [Paenibacillus sp. HB172176]
MRKISVLFVVLFMLAASFHVQSAGAVAADSWLDVSELSKGVVSISYPVKKNVKTKAMVVKGKSSYSYNLTAAVEKESFELQLGNGAYKIYVLENVSGNSYKATRQGEVTLSLKDDKTVFLNSVQNVNWTSSDKAIKKAAELAKGKKSDEEIVKAVYDYMTSTIVYDNELAKSIPWDYLPSIDRTYSTQKAICYDYASMFASMLRSQGIPTKLVMGNSEYVKVYHAWNEVYLDGEWVTIDTTVDATLKQANKKVEWLKDSKKYTTEKVY